MKQYTIKELEAKLEEWDKESDNEWYDKRIVQRFLDWLTGDE